MIEIEEDKAKDAIARVVKTFVELAKAYPESPRLADHRDALKDALALVQGSTVTPMGGDCPPDLPCP